MARFRYWIVTVTYETMGYTITVSRTVYHKSRMHALYEYALKENRPAYGEPVSITVEVK